MEILASRPIEARSKPSGDLPTQTAGVQQSGHSTTGIRVVVPAHRTSTLPQCIDAIRQAIRPVGGEIASTDGVLIAVGAAFDFLSGHKRQAPPWMRRSGLEMVFRVLTEPRRLWKRFLFFSPTFVLLVILQKLRLLRPSPSGEIRLLGIRLGVD